MRRAWIILAVVGLAGAAHAETSRSNATDAQSRLLQPHDSTSRHGRLPDILVEIDRQQAVLDSRKSVRPVDAPPKRIAHRIYLHYFVPESKWLYVLTDSDGLYPYSPPEFLRIGSVVDGKYLGAARADQRYLLNRQGIWVPTFRSEAMYFMMHGRHPRIRQIELATFTELAKAAGPRSTASVVAGTAIGAGAGAESAYVLEGKGSASAPKLVVAGGAEAKLVKTTGPLLAQRAYAIFNTREEAWSYTWTSHAGKLSRPLEILYKGTVLPGSYLGAKNPYQNYRLTDDNRWVETDEKERQYLLFPSHPNVIKRVTFITPPIDPDEQHTWK